MDYEVIHDFDKQEEGDLTMKTGEVVTLISIRFVGYIHMSLLYLLLFAFSALHQYTARV